MHILNGQHLHENVLQISLNVGLTYMLISNTLQEFFIITQMLTPISTKILKIKVIKQNNAGHNIYIRHIQLNVNSVHRILNIKYI